MNVRLDKWLWAARFFKTRSLAATAIGGGKVHVNGHRAKRATIVRVGDALQIRKGPFEYSIVIQGVSERRGPASEAAGLYREAPESVSRREKLAAELRARTTIIHEGKGRPTKRDRRKLEEFKRRGR